MKKKFVMFLLLFSVGSLLMTGCSKKEEKQAVKWYQDCNSQGMKNAYQDGFKQIIATASSEWVVNSVEVNSIATTVAEKPHLSCKVNLLFDVTGYGKGTLDLTLNIENVREDGNIDFNCVASNELREGVNN